MDRHLRSTDEVTGYHFVALDGEIGHVDDFIIDDETWAIRYLVVATKNWWPGKRVLISPKWIENVSWEEREVAIGLSRENIKAAPEYTDESLLTRDYETGLYGHYNREGYWVDELMPSEYIPTGCYSSFVLNMLWKRISHRLLRPRRSVAYLCP